MQRQQYALWSLCTIVTLAVFTVRLVRSRSRVKPASSASANLASHPPRYLGFIGPAALRLLIETAAVPHTVIQLSAADAQGPLPAALSASAITLPTSEAADILSREPSQWQIHSTAAQEQSDAGQTTSATPTREPCPRQGELVCLVAESGDVAHTCACVLASQGYHRVTITEATSPQGAAGDAVGDRERVWGGQAVQLRYINRDGLAALLGYTQAPLGIPYVLIDLRRHDERTLYGTIRGSVHVPVEQLPSALSLSATEFEATYHCPKPTAGLPVVLMGRTSRRPAWAAQVCEDAGLWPVFVYRQGTQGWRLDESVKRYNDYRVGDPPPEPDVFQIEMADETLGVEELISLGLLTRPLQ